MKKDIYCKYIRLCPSKQNINFEKNYSNSKKRLIISRLLNILLCLKKIKVHIPLFPQLYEKSCTV